MLLKRTIASLATLDAGVAQIFHGPARPLVRIRRWVSKTFTVVASRRSAA